MMSCRICRNVVTDPCDDNDFVCPRCVEDMRGIRSLERIADALEKLASKGEYAVVSRVSENGPKRDAP